MRCLTSKLENKDSPFFYNNFFLGGGAYPVPPQKDREGRGEAILAIFFLLSTALIGKAKP